MTSLYLPITTLTLVALTAWLIVLTMRIVKARHQEQVSLGDGNSELLQRRVRAQGNLVEYAPFGVLLVGLAEAQGGNPYILAAIALAFVAGRLLHGYALSFTDGNMKARVSGMQLTAVGLGGGALYALSLVFTAAP